MEVKKSKTENNDDLMIIEKTDLNNNNNNDINQSDEYFESYSPFEVHKLMISDRPRTETYLEAIKQNISKIENKIVMDVGCGTGILSMFCAKYGKAKKVIAVERNDMANYAKKLISKNNLNSIIEVFQTSIENLKIDFKVDIIISEWMGFYLVHEGMLDSVLYARDHFLKENGLMFPDFACMYCAPCNLDSFLKEEIYFWEEDIYGLDFSPLQEPSRFQLSQKPQILTLEKEKLICEAIPFFSVNLNQISEKDFKKISQNFKFQIKGQVIDGFCIWWEVKFPGDIKLDTSPFEKETHWKQSVVVLPQPVTSFDDFLEINLTFLKENRKYQVGLEFLGKIENEEEEEEDDDDDENIHEEDYDPNCNCGKCKLIRALDEQFSEPSPNDD